MAPTANLKTASKNPMMEIAMLTPMISERRFSKEEFKMLADRYPDLIMEREKNGKIVILSPVKLGSGKRESMANFFLTQWWFNAQTPGTSFSASTGVELADTSIKSPDCGRVSDERLDEMTAEEQEEDYLLVPPDFIIEVRSKSDRIGKLKKKMTDSWMKNGVRLAWLIDPYWEKAYIYRENQEVEIIKGFDRKKLSGEQVLAGFEFPLEHMKLKKKKKKNVNSKN